MIAGNSLQLHFDFDLEPQVVPGQPFSLEVIVDGTISGTLDPNMAPLAFDPQRQLPAVELERRWKENMLGWLRYAATQAFQALMHREGEDPLAAVSETAAAARHMREIVAPVFGAWTMNIQELEVDFNLTDSCVSKLPLDWQDRLEEITEDSDTAAAYGPVFRNFTDDVPPVRDPRTGHQVAVRCVVQSFFTANPVSTRAILDPACDLDPNALCQVLAEKVEPWLRYAVRQGFYNTLYLQGRSSNELFSDAGYMKQQAITLCADQVHGLGVLNIDITPRYEALDGLTAVALDLPMGH